ncbi:MAG: valine--tRNA ligase [Candidatus Yonathbacteria bacterium]|nr:valine--tRNA ligase [Candidatus Yonathbacteria bacterium]
MAEIPEKLTKPYEPANTEARIYKLWEESGFFNPDVCIEKGVTKPNAEPFTIVLPPPNVTGVLHMGHGLMLTIEDIMVRFARMQGKRTLWLPGTDHAAIATQSKVEKDIYKKEGKSRHDLGREEMMRRIETFAQESHDTIIKQLKTFGASCDWSREAFTLDAKRNRAVNTVFKKMYDDGLIVRKHRIVNWDPKGQTTISDDEIVYEERAAKMYTFTYSKDFPIAISTTRPETKVGDTAVAVHPDDVRYQKYIGKEYDAVFCGVPIHIKIIADKEVDPAFGTGALGVTPAHSQTDWEIAERHGLPVVQVINEYAKMTVSDERLQNKKTTDAREVIVSWLREEGLLVKEEDVKQNVSTAERTGGIVEPLPKLQWWVAVNKPFTIEHSEIPRIPSGSQTTLKEIMKKSVAEKAIGIIPEHFEKTYFHWIENLRDWCISRQIWYGHRIPVWYRGNEVYCGLEAPDGDRWVQDPDTLDTWFSSGLWTFSTLGWPDQTEDLKIYHPTNILETGHDILFFWVARMILMTGYTLGTVPFRTVYLHGMVRDAQGRKMSKSLGNSIDPIEIAQKFGADAGRMALVVGNTPGTDTRISEDKVKAYKHFANKIWNITRFVLDNTDHAKDGVKPSLTTSDEEIIEKLNTVIKEVTADLEENHLHLASEKLYDYVWHVFADTILEDSKIIFTSGTEEEKASRRYVLLMTLEDFLKMLHPFMPFITEEIWGILSRGSKPLLLVEPWPKPFQM